MAWITDADPKHRCKDCKKNSEEGAVFYLSPGSGRLSARCFTDDRPHVLRRREARKAAALAEIGTTS